LKIYIKLNTYFTLIFRGVLEKVKIEASSSHRLATRKRQQARTKKRS